MTTFVITEDAEDQYRAISGRRQSVGRTMGEALDALAAQIEDVDIGGALVLIQKRAPDPFFTAAQHDRMESLRARRDALTDAERAELEALVNAELDATVARTDALIQQIGA